MKRLCLFSASLIALTFGCSKPSGLVMQTASTMAVSPTDTPDSILLKAAHVVPTDNQYRAMTNEYIAFVHFGPNTFTRREWGTGFEDPKVFDLKHLDTDQWCQAIQEAGMKKIILTAKHHDGFVIWQSRYTKHGIMSSPFENGQGDVVKNLAASCQKYGLKLGIYLSPADLYQIESPEGLYGNLSEARERTIPEPVEGRPFENKTTFKFVVDDYNAYFLNQLFELLTEYGPIHEVWFDGAHPKRKGNQQYNYAAWKELIHTLAPEAVIFGKEDIRWCGNEDGGTRDTEWNVIPYQEDPNTMNQFHDLMDGDLGSNEKLMGAKYLHYQPAETNTSVREGWFYSNDSTQLVRSADDVFDMYERAVGGNSIFLLNMPPNRDGVLPAEDVQVITEAGRRIRETYGTNLLEGAKGPKEVLDNDASTFTLLDSVNNTIEISLPKPAAVNRFLIQEAVKTHGERVAEHSLEAWVDGQWHEISRSTNIGYKRILRFPTVTTDQFRLKVLRSRYMPAIATVSAHYCEVAPPQLEAVRQADGLVTIQPKKHVFRWNQHGVDPIANLNRDMEIRYTLDGSEPTAESALFTEPVAVEGKTLKACAFNAGKSGAVLTETIGLVKKNWNLVSADSETAGFEAAKAFDENPATYWLSAAKGAPHSLTIDLGETRTISGFAYTPQRVNNVGMIQKGSIEFSLDGKNWTAAEPFEFGNLINMPTKRSHALKQTAEARFVRLKSTEIAGDSKQAAVAEIDLY